METSSTALALLQWGITATVYQTPPVSILPSHQPLQANAWNAILRNQPESRNLNQDTELGGHTEIESQQDPLHIPRLKWCLIPPNKSCTHH